MVDRVKQVMEYYEETPASFSEKLGVNRSNLTHLFSGRNQPSLDFAKKVLKAFPEVSTEWLIMGVGKMVRTPDEIAPAKREFVQTELFDTVDESESEERRDGIITTVRSEVAPQQEDFEKPLENVKQVVPEEVAEKDTQVVESKVIKPVKEPVLTAAESNIQQPTVHVAEKIDSKPVTHAVVQETKEEPVAELKPEPKVEPVKQAATVPTVQVASEPLPLKEKKVEKIIFFYDDDSFKIYHP